MLGEKISGGSSWSKNDNMAFERALALYSDETESRRWEKIAAVLRGKTVEQIKEHYDLLVHDVMMIESGCVPLPDYDFSKEKNVNTSYNKGKSIWECGNSSNCEYQQICGAKVTQQRRKGISWTADEHRNFLQGLEKYGRGDWRSISRHCVVTRTPTQVASHAQKYFARLKPTTKVKIKNKNRPSIHDVTVEEGRSISTNPRPITWQNTQATSQPSLDRPIYGTHNMWNTPATSQPSLDRPMYGAHNMWSTQVTSQPLPDLPMTYGTPSTIWNTQAAAAQPSVNIPTYGQSTIPPMVSPFGSDTNLLAPPPMANGVQHDSVPYSSVPSAPPINMGSIPYNMTYIPQSGI